MPGTADLTPIAPLAALAVGALVVVAADLLAPRSLARPWAYAAALAAVVLAGWYWTGLWQSVQDGPLTSFFGAVVSDRLSAVLAGMMLVTACLVVLISLAHKERDMAGYLSLVLLAASGMMALGGAGDLMVLFTALELFSLSLYALIAFQREREAAKEGAFKYLVLGSMASGFLLYGFGLIYGAVGSLSLDAIAAYAGRRRPFAALSCGLCTVVGRLRVQAGFGAVPRLGSGCIPGRAHTRRRADGCRHQGCRPGGAGPLRVDRGAACGRLGGQVHAAPGGAVRSEHDGGQPGDAVSNQRQTVAGLFQHHPRGLLGHAHCGLAAGRFEPDALLFVRLHADERGSVRCRRGLAAAGRDG